MPVTAKLSYLRIAPRKVRLVADLIRGKKTDQASNVLRFNADKSAAVILKLLNQAIANAKNNNKLDGGNLFISKIIVNAGPILKRSRPRARGSAYEIQKKTSHIIITLEEIQKGLKKTEAQTPIPAPKRAEAPDENAGGSKKAPQTARKPEKETSKQKFEGVKQKIFRRQVF